MCVLLELTRSRGEKIWINAAQILHLRKIATGTEITLVTGNKLLVTEDPIVLQNEAHRVQRGFNK